MKKGLHNISILLKFCIILFDIVLGIATSTPRNPLVVCGVNETPAHAIRKRQADLVIR